MNHNVNIQYAGYLALVKGSFDPQKVTTYRLRTTALKVKDRTTTRSSCSTLRQTQMIPYPLLQKYLLVHVSTCSFQNSQGIETVQMSPN